MYKQDLNGLNHVDRKVTLNFSKQFVTESIKTVCEYKKSNVSNFELNGIMGTFRITISAGIFQFVVLNLVISDNTENKCEITINACNAGGGTLPLSTLNIKTDDFFNLVSLVLSGESLPIEKNLNDIVIDENTPNEQNDQNDNSGLFGLIFGLIFIGLLLYFINR